MSAEKYEDERSMFFSHGSDRPNILPPLPTNIKNFLSFLKLLCDEERLTFPSELGKLHIDIAETNEQRSSSKTYEIYINWRLPKEEDEGQISGGQLSGTITIEIQCPFPNNIEVGFDCNTHEIQPILSRIIERIKEKYLEHSIEDRKEKFLSDKALGQPVSPETVQKYHKLAKTTNQSANKIQNDLGTYTNTYYRYCKKYTSEEPIDMKERAALIKKNNWPQKRSDGVTE